MFKMLDGIIVFNNIIYNILLNHTCKVDRNPINFCSAQVMYK